MADFTQKPDEQSGAAATPPADSTIPENDTGVAAGYTGEPSTFEPEEDAPADDGTKNGSEDTDAPGGGSGPRRTEATGLTGEDRSIFQSHWDDFPDHTR